MKDKLREILSVDDGAETYQRAGNLRQLARFHEPDLDVLIRWSENAMERLQDLAKNDKGSLPVWARLLIDKAIKGQ